MDEAHEFTRLRQSVHCVHCVHCVHRATAIRWRTLRESWWTRRMSSPASDSRWRSLASHVPSATGARRFTDHGSDLLVIIFFVTVDFIHYQKLILFKLLKKNVKFCVVIFLNATMSS